MNSHVNWVVYTITHQCVNFVKITTNTFNKYVYIKYTSKHDKQVNHKIAYLYVHLSKKVYTIKEAKEWLRKEK